MAELTDDQLSHRLLGSPSRCPGCEGTDLDAERPTLADHDDCYELVVNCENCGGSWTEEYRLSGGRGWTPQGED